ncbi:MAG: hypothetical protein VX901_05995 [Candidatus Poribacteria bacterium]|nr:hypothetical protein [Candidatus Poribacteria bacterium]
MDRIVNGTQNQHQSKKPHTPLKRNENTDSK